MSYMIQTIFPSLMMVVCSYGSLFIPHDQASSRDLALFTCGRKSSAADAEMRLHGFSAGSGSHGALDNDDADVGDPQQRPLQHVSAHFLLEGSCSILVLIQTYLLTVAPLGISVTVSGWLITVSL